MSWEEVLEHLASSIDTPHMSSGDRRRYLVLCMRYNAEVDVACFLIERGSSELYEAILSSLTTSLFDMPPGAKARIEASFMNWSMAQSDAQFMVDHAQRQRGSIAADRVDEIVTSYPFASATMVDLSNCPTCTICQHDLRRRKARVHYVRTCPWWRREMANLNDQQLVT